MQKKNLGRYITHQPYLGLYVQTRYIGHCYCLLLLWRIRPCLQAKWFQSYSVSPENCLQWQTKSEMFLGESRTLPNGGPKPLSPIPMKISYRCGVSMSATCGREHLIDDWNSPSVALFHFLLFHRQYKYKQEHIWIRNGAEVVSSGWNPFSFSLH